QGNVIRAREELERALRLWVSIGNRGMRAGTLVDLGNLRWDLGQLAEAEEAQLEAQQEAQASGYLRQEGYAAASLGDVLRDRRKFERSQQAYERGLMIAEKAGDRFLQVVALDGLARCYLYAGSAGLAHATIARARLLADERESPYEQGLCADTLGLFYLVDGRLDLAIRELERAHGQLESRSSVRERARVKLHLGLALLRRGDRERARELAQTALRLLPAQAKEPLLAMEGEWLSELLQLVGPAGPSWLADLVELPVPRLSAARPTVVSPNRAILCFTLGRSDVELDGSPVGAGEWQTQKAKELWFYLLAHGPVPRNQVIEALWPDSQLAKGLSALHTTLHRLRRTLFVGCVERQGELYGISPSANVWSDDRDFERAAIVLRRLETVELSEEQITTAAKAVNLYRGPYLESIDAAWCDTRRQGLQVLYLRLLRSLVEQAHLAQHFEQAISFAELFLQTEPDDEGIHELIMRSHALGGNRSAALRHYQRYAQQLRDELATQPSRRLRSLVDQISREG
ncbi:MAG TPA: BTAD domain-containing putative transcriptional regulator, partial [Candidatus Dormibacteraeota bacterium]